MGTDGSLLFVRHQTGLPRDFGDNSNEGRRLRAAILDSEKKKPARKDPPPAIGKSRLPPPMAKKLPQATTCAIEGCAFGGTPMQADHKCHNKCGRVFHNLCAQDNDLCDEDNELDVCRSMECKRSEKQISFVCQIIGSCFHHITSMQFRMFISRCTLLSIVCSARRVAAL